MDDSLFYDLSILFLRIDIIEHCFLLASVLRLWRIATHDRLMKYSGNCTLHICAVLLRSGRAFEVIYISRICELDISAFCDHLVKSRVFRHTFRCVVISSA